METTKEKDADNYNVAIPKNIYKLRVLECTDGETKNGNRVFKGKAELAPKVEGQPTMINGVCVDGVQFFFNSVVTPKTVKFVNKFRSALGLSKLTEETLGEAYAEEYVGQEGFALCQCKKEAETDDDGNQLVDPYTSAPVFSYKREVMDWYPRPE